MKHILPTVALCTTLVAAAPAVAHEGAKTGPRKVCEDSTYVRHTPKLTMIGTLFKGQTIKVTRYDSSHKYAYGFAYGHVRKHGWVKAADLCD
jgi:hypothetical protein